MSIHASTHIDSVHLTIPDLDRSLRYYVEHLGFALNWREAEVAAVGVDGRDLLVLHESRGATRAPGTTGLYHVAILLPSRGDLARCLRRLMERRTPMTGFSDHGVSEAVYLSDPDGNGLEIYRDRPKEEWPMAGGRLQMVTEPLNLAGLLRDSDTDGVPRSPGMPAGTRVGHVHLHVAHLEDTERFYVDVLGFDLIQRYGDSALFMSAGGYHHHVGANTWVGVGAPPPPAGAIGLDRVVIGLPDETAIAAAEARLQSAGVASTHGPEGLDMSDPSGNRLRLAVR